jgi:hypothetical protein
VDSEAESTPPERHLAASAVPLDGVHPDAEPIEVTSEPAVEPVVEPVVEPIPDRPPPPPTLPVVEVEDLDWTAVRRAVEAARVRSRLRETVENMEALLDRDDGPGLLFDADRADPSDRAIRVATLDPATPLWIIGDLHGDLLALEAAARTDDEEQGGEGETHRRLRRA